MFMTKIPPFVFSSVTSPDVCLMLGLLLLRLTSFRACASVSAEINTRASPVLPLSSF